MAFLETIQVQLHEDYYCEIKKYRGSHGGEYYSVNGINYDIHFPIEWVFQFPDNQIEYTTIPFGPDTCYDCFMNGYYNGVFIGYCTNCAQYCNYKRGNGLEYGIEREEEHLDPNNSIWNLYLQNVLSLAEIGDRQLLVDYEYKIQYYHRHSVLHRVDDDITVTYNDRFVYSSSEYEDDADTITSFSYNNDSIELNDLDSESNYDYDIDSIS